ncbi:UDP-N-acetylmuramoyl-L-alanine--D-glutamate ligase [Colwelliaceae bacterium 6471]
MKLSQLSNKNVLILGAGVTGMSCARFLRDQNIHFAINDSRAQLVSDTEFHHDFPDCQLSLGNWDTALITAADVIIASPGIDMQTPAIKSAISDRADVIGDVELYCRLGDTPLLAVTGSNGKSTVVTLLAYLGQSLGVNCQLGGNIGVPVLDHLTNNQAPDIDVIALELSSFQLETISSMKAIAATVLNISDDHLDRHKTLENYRNIKHRIYEQAHVVLVNRDDVLTQVSAVSPQQKLISFGSDKPTSGNFGIDTIDGRPYLMYGEQALIAVAELPIAGMHNALNCLAALALGMSAGWSLTGMVAQLPNFKSLEHRCQHVPSSDGIIWINDSKATNVGATLAAIAGLAATLPADNHLILIAGGDGKGADFSALKTAMEQHVSQLITLGKDGNEIAKLSADSIKVNSIEQAVINARSIAKSGDVVLLSPACASIDMFNNFAERGEAFMQAVKTGDQLNERSLSC